MIEDRDDVDHNDVEDSTNDEDKMVDDPNNPTLPVVTEGSRQSQRLSHPPIRIKDYVTQVSDSIQPYSLRNYISYQGISLSYVVY